MTGDHPVYWTAHLRCGDKILTQGKPAPGNWVSCDCCHTQQQILTVTPVLREAPVPAGWVQEALPFVAALEAAA